jgi:hypothetical protein
LTPQVGRATICANNHQSRVSKRALETKAIRVPLDVFWGERSCNICPALRCNASIRYAMLAVTGYAPTPAVRSALMGAAHAAATCCATCLHRWARASECVPERLLPTVRGFDRASAPFRTFSVLAPRAVLTKRARGKRHWPSSCTRFLCWFFIAKLWHRCGSNGNRPMSVSELPAAVSIFCGSGKEPCLLYAVARCVHQHLVPGSSHDGQLGCEWIYA